MLNESIEELLTRGVTEVISLNSLRKKLQSGQPLRIKLGIDPTGPRLHLGRSIPLLKLKDFQALGHQVVLIVGDFTGQIGDTSDKESERPMLTEDQIKENMAGYLEQVGLILDLGKVEVHYNSEWLSGLTLAAIAKLADAFSVHEFTEREVIKRRLNAGKRVNMRELLYPIMQGYDSVAVKADVELGGTDQRFNLLAGRTLMERADMIPQDVLMTELINGTDGTKMSTSKGNTVFLNAEPNEMFGQLMSINDDLIITYFTLLTRVPLSQIKEFDEQLKGGMNPRDIKLKLARAITTFYNTTQAAALAEEHFIKTVSKGERPTNIPTVAVKPGDYALADLLVLIKQSQSKSAARRLIEQGAVSVDEAAINDGRATLTVHDGMILKVGKRSWVKLTIS